VHAAWLDGERDSGRFTGWLSAWKNSANAFERPPVDQR
jgi:hypothetical protein